MPRIIPREKLGKRARKALDSEARAVWGFRPVTRRVDSRKVYNRKRRTRDRWDGGAGSFYEWNYSGARA